MSAKEVVISSMTFVIKKIYLFFTKLFLSNDKKISCNNVNI